MSLLSCTKSPYVLRSIYGHSVPFDQDLANYSLLAKPSPVFVNNVQLEPVHTHSSTYCLWLLLCYNNRRAEQLWQKLEAFHSLQYLPSECRRGLPDPYVEVIVYLPTIKVPHFQFECLTVHFNVLWGLISPCSFSFSMLCFFFFSEQSYKFIFSM